MGIWSHLNTRGVNKCARTSGIIIACHGNTITEVRNLHIGRIEAVDGLVGIAIVAPAMVLAVVQKHHASEHATATVATRDVNLGYHLRSLIIQINHTIGNLERDGAHRSARIKILDSYCIAVIPRRINHRCATVDGIDDVITFTTDVGFTLARGFIRYGENNSWIWHFHLSKVQGDHFRHLIAASQCSRDGFKSGARRSPLKRFGITRPVGGARIFAIG